MDTTETQPDTNAATAFIDRWERSAEEAQGKIRWLRPDYQNPNQAREAGDGRFVGGQER